MPQRVHPPAHLTPIQAPATAPWILPLPPTDLSKLATGFRPASMDDKWLCFSRGDAHAQQNGILLVSLCRSWTSREFVVLRVKTGGGGDAQVCQITWETESGCSEDEAKDLAAGVCRGVLGCEGF
ncbi:hypothetical protein CDD82_6942 [Ophiocordyceps australis]|uniref:Uncharacterized protein n=1 Tax=Ophiocordyceps australis TaxID=1399860 RepID=A0A2C5YVH0_9HYPO|nr:hypothetical protein CDD82_6942 [Ophiocordyceps australis]